LDSGRFAITSRSIQRAASAERRSKLGTHYAAANGLRGTAPMIYDIENVTAYVGSQLSTDKQTTTDKLCVIFLSAGRLFPAELESWSRPRKLKRLHCYIGRFLTTALPPIERTNNAILAGIGAVIFASALEFCVPVRHGAACRIPMVPAPPVTIASFGAGGLASGTRSWMRWLPVTTRRCR
jgi:hypothetical protein